MPVAHPASEEIDKPLNLILVDRVAHLASQLEELSKDDAVKTLRMLCTLYGLTAY